MGLSDAEREEMRRLRSKGWSIGKIAKRTGHSKSTVHEVVKDSQKGKAVQRRKNSLNLNAPFLEELKAVLPMEAKVLKNISVPEEITTAEVILIAVDIVLGDLAREAKECKDFPSCSLFRDYSFVGCNLCHLIGEEREKGELINKMDLILAALVRQGIKIFCPHCEKWVYPNYDADGGIWICPNCKNEPFKPPR